MGPFAKAVMAAEANGGIWDFEYYRNGGEYPSNRHAVYHHSRNVALGPEWKTLQRCVLQMEGKLPRC